MVRNRTRGRVTFIELDKIRFGTVFPAVNVQRPFATVEAVTPTAAQQDRRKFQTTATGVRQYGGEVQAGAAVQTDGREIQLQAKIEAVTCHFRVRKDEAGFLPPGMQGAEEKHKCEVRIPQVKGIYCIHHGCEFVLLT